MVRPSLKASCRSARTTCFVARSPSRGPSPRSTRSRPRSRRCGPGGRVPMASLPTGSHSTTTPAPSTRCAATGRSTRSSLSADQMNADSRPPARTADRPGAAGPVCTLGLDLGTSSAKAVVIDTGGKVLSQASAGYAVTSAMAGYAESEPAHWWSAVTACAREAIQAAGARPAAIGLSGQMHGLVLTSAAGGALRPALLWADSRATGSLRAYQRRGSRALARLANPLAPGMTGPLLVWIAQNGPRVYREARWALQPKDWIRARLTGEVHAEPSDASATLLYDVPGDRWDLEVVSALGLDPSLLAPLLPSAGAPAGHLTAEAGTELGLPAGIPVAAGAADTAASALGPSHRRPPHGGSRARSGTARAHPRRGRGRRHGGCGPGQRDRRERRYPAHRRHRRASHPVCRRTGPRGGRRGRP